MAYKIYPEKSSKISKKITRFLKLKARKFCFKTHTKKLEDLINSKSEFCKYFETYPRFAVDLVHKIYGSTSFSRSCGFENLTNDLLEMLKFYNHLNVPFGEKITMFEFEIFNHKNFSLALLARPSVSYEGIFQLGLFADDTCFYKLSFNLGNDYLLISAIQGLKDANELNKDFTKASFGLRPAIFLIYMAKIWAKMFNRDRLIGVANKNQCSKFKDKRMRNGRIYVICDYDKFWIDYCGSLPKIRQNGNFILKESRKALDDIESKKRSMYKKRWALLEKIESNINNFKN